MTNAFDHLMVLTLSGVFERKDPLPVVLHADHCPAVLLRFIVKCLGERADLAGGKSLCRAVGVFAFRVVVQLAPFLSAFRIANSKAGLVEALFPLGA
jgi:hypothetical protein